MRRTKLGGLAAAGVLAAVPAVAFAAATKTIRPEDGSFTGSPHYKVSGTAETAQLTIPVTRHAIAGVQLIARVLPLDRRTSHGPACGSANEITTQGYKRSGTIARDGHFSYTFASKGKGYTDKITLVGRFTSPTAATGVLRDRDNVTVARSYCDTGKVRFSVTHS
jgi:hypothetical protein